MGFEHLTPEQRREISIKGGNTPRERPALRTVCRRGHDLTGDNALRGMKTRKPVNGSEPYQYPYVVCRICLNERRRTRYLDHKHADRG